MKKIFMILFVLLPLAVFASDDGINIRIANHGSSDGQYVELLVSPDGENYIADWSSSKQETKVNTRVKQTEDGRYYTEVYLKDNYIGFDEKIIIPLRASEINSQYNLHYGREDGKIPRVMTNNNIITDITNNTSKKVYLNDSFSDVVLEVAPNETKKNVFLPKLVYDKGRGTDFNGMKLKTSFIASMQGKDSSEDVVVYKKFKDGGYIRAYGTFKKADLVIDNSFDDSLPHTINPDMRMINFINLTNGDKFIKYGFLGVKLYDGSPVNLDKDQARSVVVDTDGSDTPTIIVGYTQGADKNGSYSLETRKFQNKEGYVLSAALYTDPSDSERIKAVLYSNSEHSAEQLVHITNSTNHDISFRTVYDSTGGVGATLNLKPKDTVVFPISYDHEAKIFKFEWKKTGGIGDFSPFIFSSNDKPAVDFRTDQRGTDFIVVV
ncbi:hypothetical protein QIW49_00810 [Francisellaceae bacterium CB300]